MEFHIKCDYFVKDNLVVTKSTPIFKGRYTLIIETYKTESTSWYYSWAKVLDSNQVTILSIQHNYPHFPHEECVVNDNDYMITASSYDKGMLINLTTRKVWKAVDSFCWMGGSVSPDERTLFVGGCYWACPEEGGFYDITDDALVKLSCPTIPYGKQYDDEDGQPCEDGKSTTIRWLSNEEIELTIHEIYIPSLGVSESQAYRNLIDGYGISSYKLDGLDELKLERRVIDIKHYRRVGDSIIEM